MNNKLLILGLIFCVLIFGTFVFSSEIPKSETKLNQLSEISPLILTSACCLRQSTVFRSSGGKMTAMVLK